MIGQSAKYIIVLAGLVLLTFLVIVFSNRMAEQRQLVAQAEEVRAELSALRQTEANLDAQLAYATSDAAVKEWAYQEARWVLDGDHPVVPVSPSERTSAAPPADPSEPVQYATWQIWWALFFDDATE